MRMVFVTVGTTRFDALVEAALSGPFLAAVAGGGFGSLVVQRGRSDLPDSLSSLEMKDDDGEMRWRDSPTGVLVTVYRFKASLEGDMRASAAVVSHAGAGTIIEAQALRRPLLVVANAALMDDHQQELAAALHLERCLRVVASPLGLAASFNSFLEVDFDFDGVVASGGDGFDDIDEVDGEILPPDASQAQRSRAFVEMLMEATGLKAA